MGVALLDSLGKSKAWAAHGSAQALVRSAEEAFRWLRGVICSHEGLALSQVLGAMALKDPSADQLVALLTTIYRALSAAGSPLAGAVPSLWHDAAVRMLRVHVIRTAS